MAEPTLRAREKIQVASLVFLRALMAGPQAYRVTLIPDSASEGPTWVLRETFLSSGNPMRNVLAAWEQESRIPDAQQKALPQLKRAMNERGTAIRTISRIMKDQAELVNTILGNLR